MQVDGVMLSCQEHLSDMRVETGTGARQSEGPGATRGGGVLLSEVLRDWPHGGGGDLCSKMWGHRSAVGTGALRRLGGSEDGLYRP